MTNLLSFVRHMGQLTNGTQLPLVEVTKINHFSNTIGGFIALEILKVQNQKK